MFRHSSCPSSAPSYSDAFMHDAAGSFSAGAAFPDGGNVGATFPPFAVATASSSSPPSYSPLPSSYYNIHRSTSLPLYHQLADALNSGSAFFSSSSPSPHQLPPPPPLSSSPSSSSGDLFEFTSSGPVRRVFSTGDLQGMNRTSPLCSLLSDDSCGQDGGGPFSQKVGRYSAEERKERIERYRVKRHQRNFNKKITYGCRKTLADSRPRVKGRFARNGEAEGEADEREASDNSYDYGRVIDPGNHSSGNSCLPGAQYNNDGTCSNGATAFVGGSDNGEWWWRVPGATAAAADEAERQRQVGFDVDEELWATLDDILSVNETEAYVGGRWGPAHEHEH